MTWKLFAKGWKGECLAVSGQQKLNSSLNRYSSTNFIFSFHAQVNDLDAIGIQAFGPRDVTSGSGSGGYFCGETCY